MKLKNIKLVISDMDGTLLNSKHEVSVEFLDLFNKLKEHNVLFVAASGRPHYSIVSKLNAIKNCIVIAGENGGVITYKEQELLVSGLSNNSITDICKLLVNLKDCHPIFCTQKKAYINRRSEEIIPLIKEYYNNYELIDNVKDVTEAIIKIAIFNELDAESNVYKHLKTFNSKFKIKLSGKQWVDICDPNTNKGVALEIIKNKFNILADEVLAFGDYKNDIEMLKMTSNSVAMANAHDSVKQICNYETLSNDNNGVEFILKQLISQKES